MKERAQPARGDVWVVLELKREGSHVCLEHRETRIGSGQWEELGPRAVHRGLGFKTVKGYDTLVWPAVTILEFCFLLKT